MPVKFLTWILTALAAAALLAGCINDVPTENFPEETEKPAGNIFVRLHIGLKNNASRADGTAGDGTPIPENPGTSQEQAINSVDIYVCDAATGELIDYVPVPEEQIANIQDDNNEDVTIPIFVEDGRKVHIYAAANLPYNLRAAFVKGQNCEEVAVKAPAKDYQDVINYFVPGSDGFQETLQKTADNKISGDESFIPMTGQFTTDDASPTAEITITKDMTAENPLHIKADISRIVAKVHVLATTLTKDISTGETIEYVYAKGSAPETASSTDSKTEDFAGWLGWIRLKNVRYMPNSINKSTYLFLQENTSSAKLSDWKDPNMDLMPYVARINDNDIDFNNAACMNDFSYYDGMALHTANNELKMSQAEIYNETTLKNTKDGNYTGNTRYIRGMYCLENYFDKPERADDFENAPKINPAITHVSIAAKLTPRVIIILKDYKAKMDAIVYDFRNNGKFYEKYSFTEDDFNQNDVEKWEEIITDEKYKEYLDPDNTKYRYRSFLTFKASTEEDAAYILKWSLLANNLWTTEADKFKENKYTYGTFFVYDRKFDHIYDTLDNPLIEGHKYLFLTAGVINHAEEYVTIKTNSVVHPGGWCYYHTYIDNNHQAVNGSTPYYSSQVTRNTYYLLNVTNFGTPGGSISDPEYIKVNTETVAWDYNGRGEIVLH